MLFHKIILYFLFHHGQWNYCFANFINFCFSMSSGTVISQSSVEFVIDDGTEARGGPDKKKGSSKIGSMFSGVRNRFTGGADKKKKSGKKVK